MRTVLLLIRKDLLRKVRSPLGIVVTLAFPIVFSALIGLSFGGGGSVPRAHLLVENRDEDGLGNLLLGALDSNEVAKYFDIEIVGDEGRARIEKGQGSALLRIPENFTLDLIEGNPTSLELVRNPAQGIMPEVAEQVAGVLVEVLNSGSRVLRGPLEAVAPFTGDRVRIDNETVAAVAVAINATVNGAEQYLFPPVIALESINLGETSDEDPEDGQAGSSSSPMFSIFLFVFPGVSVWALFTVGDNVMRDILAESDAGTLRRQLQGPIGAGTVILSKAGATAVACSVSVAILSAIGWIVADRPVDVAGYVLLSSVLILAVTGVGAVIYGAAGTEQRGATIASVLFLTLAFAGGSFIQVEAMPRAVQAIAPISPFYWGTEGYRALLQNGAGVADILVHAGVLVALGVVTLTAGTLLLRRRLATGGVA